MLSSESRHLQATHRLAQLHREAEIERQRRVSCARPRGWNLRLPRLSVRLEWRVGTA